MNLSLYLLLAPPSDSEKSAQFTHAPLGSFHKSSTAVFDPYRPGSGQGKALHQASRRQAVTAPSAKLTVDRLGFTARVGVDALGYLLMTSGLLALLQIAQISLG